MVKTTPASSFEPTQTQLLLQFLIVTLDNPAVLGGSHQLAERGLGRERGEPVFGRLGFALRPFHEQPLLRMWFPPPVVAMRRTNPDGSEALSRPWSCSGFQAPIANPASSTLCESPCRFHIRHRRARHLPGCPLGAHAGSASARSPAWSGTESPPAP